MFYGVYCSLKTFLQKIKILTCIYFYYIVLIYLSYYIVNSSVVCFIEKRFAWEGVSTISRKLKTFHVFFFSCHSVDKLGICYST